MAHAYTPGLRVTEQDRATHIERLQTNRTAFPDGHYTLEDIIAQDDVAAARWIFSGSLQAPYAGVQGVGQPVMTFLPDSRPTLL